MAGTKVNGGFAKEVKTSHLERDVFLSPSLQNALAEHKQRQVPNELGLVIPARASGYLDPRNFLRKFKALTKSKGFKNSIS